MSAAAISVAFWNLVDVTTSASKQIPGLEAVIAYVQRSYQNDPLRTLLEIVVGLWAIRYVLSKGKQKDTTKLTEKVRWHGKCLPTVFRRSNSLSQSGSQSHWFPSIKAFPTTWNPTV